MPFLDTRGVAFGPRQLTPEPGPTEIPSFAEVLSAAWQRESVVGNFMLADRYMRAADNDFHQPGFDVREAIKGTKYERHRGFFHDTRNERSLRQRMDYVDRLEVNDRILARAGGEGLTLSIGSSVFDPINFVPVGGIALASRSKSLPRIIARSAGVGTVAAGVQEVPLKALQPDRSWMEVGANVTGSAILSGALGGALGKLARWAEAPTAFDAPTLEVAARQMRGLTDELSEIALRGGSEDDILSVVGPVLDDLEILNAPTAREVARIVQAMAPDIAEGRLSMDDVVAYALDEIPQRMGGARVAEQVSETIDNAMRQSRLEADPPLDARHLPATETPDRVAFRPQPDDGIVGFITRDDLLESSFDVSTIRGEAVRTIQLDAPIPSARTDGLVTGLRVDVDHRFLFDPFELLQGTTKVNQAEVDRVMDLIQRLGVEDGLEQAGYHGWVRLVDSTNVRTREVVLRNADEIFSEGPQGIPTFRINPGVANPVKFSEIGPLTKGNLDALEQKLRLQRVPVSGGSVGFGTVMSFDGRLVRSAEDLFDEANNPTSVFTRLGNAERLDGRVNVNNATLDDLLQVPGIGPARARAILDFLTAREGGPLEDLAELAEVRGLSPSMLERVINHLDVRDSIPAAPQDIQMSKAFGFERWLSRINPNTRVLATSKSNRLKRHFLRMFEAGGIALDTDGIIRQPVPMETLAKKYDMMLDRYTRQQWSLYLGYRSRVDANIAAPPVADIPITEASRLRGSLRILSQDAKDSLRNLRQLWNADEIPHDSGPLTYTEFRRRIGMAVYMGGKDRAADFAMRGGFEDRLRLTDPIPEVERAAIALKAEIFDPLLVDMKELGLVTDRMIAEIQNVSDGYFHRAYLDDKIKGEKHKFISVLTQHYVGVKGWDVESAVNVATRQVQSLLETPVGRMPYDLSRRNVTGAIRERMINVPDDVLMPWLETDTDAILRMYLNTVGPDIELGRYLRSVRRERVRTAAVHHLMESRGFSEGKAGDAVLRAEETLDGLELRFSEVSHELIEAQRRLQSTTAAGEAQPLQGRLAELQTESTQLRKRMDDINATLGKEWMEGTINGEASVRRLAEGRSRYDTAIGDKEPLDLRPILDDIDDDYNRSLARELQNQAAGITVGKVTPEQITRQFEILKKRDKDILHQLTDMVRNMHHHSTDDLFGVGLTRTMRGLRRWNVTTMGGGFMISSIPDLGRLVTINGTYAMYGDVLKPLLQDFRLSFDGLRPHAKLGPKSQKLLDLRTEVRDLGISFETVLNNRASLITEVQRRVPTTKLETLLERGADAMFLLNGMSLWNDTLKEVAGIQTYLKIARAAREVAEGRSLPDKLIKDFGRLGLSTPQLKRIWHQIQFGARPSPRAEIPANRILTDGIPITRFSKWDDLALMELVRSVMHKEVDNLIITPGVGDKPILMSGEIFKTLLQFKSFSFAATSRLTLASAQGLAAGDARILQQLAIMQFLGMGVFALKTLQYGGDLSKYSVQDWVAEGVDRSGAPAILSEFDGLLSAMTGGTLSAARLIGARTPTRFIARRNLTRQVLGPSWSRVEAASDLVSAIVNADLSPRDVRHIRNMIPLQNLFWLDGLFDLVEKPAKKAVRNSRRAPEPPPPPAPEMIPVPTTR